MGYVKVQHGKGAIAKIKIQEADGSILENWTIMMSDLGKWISQMRQKYGNAIDGRRNQNENRDLNWIR